MEVVVDVSLHITFLFFRDKLKLVIGFHLLKVESNREYRLHKRIVGSDCGASDYIRSRHVFLRKTLSPGRYFIIPTTFDPGQDADFLLRLFSVKTFDLSPVLLDEPQKPCFLSCGCGSRPQVVTRLTVVSATGLKKQDVIGRKLDHYNKHNIETHCVQKLTRMSI